MSAEPSFLNYFLDASLVVKAVMLILIALSVLSWTFIFQRGIVLKRARLAVAAFDDVFWSGADLTKLCAELQARYRDLAGLENIFYTGFKEFMRLAKQPNIHSTAIIEGVQRVMRIISARETDNLEQHLAFLATVGSTSPYIGLFGTVWGIMTSFSALNQAQQATIAMVAPGISEALVATAMGLFAAIPAVIAYNRYANEVDRLARRYETFQEEFSSILHRQVHGSERHAAATV